MERAEIKFIKSSDDPKGRYGFAYVLDADGNRIEGDDIFTHHGDCRFVTQLADGSPAFAEYDRDQQPSVPEPGTIIVFERQPGKPDMGDRAKPWADANDWDAIAAPDTPAQPTFYVVKDDEDTPVCNGATLDELSAILAASGDGPDFVGYQFYVRIEAQVICLNGVDVNVPAHYAPCDNPCPQLVPA